MASRAEVMTPGSDTLERATAQCRTCGQFVSYVGIASGVHSWDCKSCGRYLERTEVHLFVHVSQSCKNSDSIYHLHPQCKRINDEDREPKTKTLTMLTKHWRPCTYCGPGPNP